MAVDHPTTTFLKHTHRAFYSDGGGIPTLCKMGEFMPKKEHKKARRVFEKPTASGIGRIASTTNSANSTANDWE